jgi:hypothetical protein
MTPNASDIFEQLGAPTMWRDRYSLAIYQASRDFGSVPGNVAHVSLVHSGRSSARSTPHSPNKLR